MNKEFFSRSIKPEIEEMKNNILNFQKYMNETFRKELKKELKEELKEINNKKFNNHDNEINKIKLSFNKLLDGFNEFENKNKKVYKKIKERLKDLVQKEEIRYQIYSKTEDESLRKVKEAFDIELNNMNNKQKNKNEDN